jgi:hypothetical protein
VTLSGNEAEYVTISEGVKKIKFIYFILPDNRIDVELLIFVNKDSINATFMAQNALTGVLRVTWILSIALSENKLE